MKSIKLYTLTLIFTFTNVSSSHAWNPFRFLQRGGDEAAETATDGARRAAPETVGRITPRLNLEDVITPVRASGLATGLDGSAQDVAAIFRREKKAAPINVALAGTGKSEFVRYLQHLINTNSELVSNLHGKTIYDLNVNRITAGTELQGSLQQRFDEMIQMISDPAHSDKILVVDELEEVLKDEKHGRAFIEAMKSYMAGEMTGAKLMFNITPPAYEKLMTDAQLIRRMVKVFRDPPSDEVVNNILRVLSEHEAAKKGIVLSQQQLDQIFRLSKMHPTLSNPDVAITLLDDTINRALADLETGARKITEVRTEITNLNQRIEAIDLNQQQGVLKFFGPFFASKRARLVDMKERLEGVVRSYDDSRHATAELREELIQKMRRKRELQETINTNDANLDFGDVTPQDELDRVNDRINSLSASIKDENPLLTGVEATDEHILEAARVNLPRSQAQILDEMNGGLSSAAYANRLVENNPRFQANYDVVKTIAQRVLLKRRVTRDSGELPAFLIIDHTGENANALAKSVSRELYETDPYTINGSEITDRTSLNRDLGAPDGYGSGNTGALYKAGLDSNGYMTLLISDFQRGVQDLLSTVENIIGTKRVRSNRGEMVDFNDTSVFMTTSDEAFKMTDENLSAFNSLRTEAERQDFLRQLVKNNFQGRRTVENPEGFRVNDSLMERVHVIYLDNQVRPNLDIEISNRIKGDEFRDALDRLEVNVELDESAISHVANIARQRAGNANITRLIEDEILSFLYQATENGRLVPGDNALLHVSENGGYVLARQNWGDRTLRQALVSEQVARFGGEVSEEAAQEALDDPRAILDGLLDESSRLR